MITGLLSNCDVTTVSLSLVLAALVLYYFKSRKPKNFPPGPAGVPILGYTPFMNGNAPEKVMKLKEKYGPVVGLQIGLEDWVFLNDYATIHEALVKRGEIFSGRPKNELMDYFTKGLGIGMLDYGEMWKSQRKFGVITLRGFGFGKKGMEANVIEELPYLLELLMTKGDDALRKKLLMAVSNIISRVVFGARFSYDDERFQRIIRIFEQFGGESTDAKLLGVLSMAPVFRHLPVFRGAMKRVYEENEKYVGIIKGITDEHKATFNVNDIRDFTDAFISEMRERGDGDPVFHDEQLFQYVRDIYEAGTTTTNSTLYWCLLCMAHYPNYQDKIVKEIHEAMGENGIPTMKHRDQMPFTCALLQEILRTKPLAPFSVFHKTNEPCILNGYSIPKNTTIMPNIWSVHFDPEIFENPNEFRPERFIDAEGHFVKSSYVIPFSVGPRHCMGEQLARMELFIFFTAILQKLRIIPDPSKPLPDFHNGVFNVFSYEAPEFEVIFEKR